MSDAPKTLLRAAWVAPMDRPPFRDAAVVLAGEKIVAVGDARKLAADHPDASQRDLGNAAVLPGLINAHTHLELSDFTRLADVSSSSSPTQSWTGRPLAEWLIEVIKGAPQDDDADRVRRAVETGVGECLRFGVTAVGDISRQASFTRLVLRDTPLRVVSFGEVQAMAGRRHLLKERLAAATDRSLENGRLRVGVSPHAPYSVEPEGYRRCVELAGAAGMPLSTHLAESPDEAPFLADHTGPFRGLWDFLNAWDEKVPRFESGPIRFAEAAGLLDLPAALAHVNYCDDDELRLLAAGNASVIYCPRTHDYFGHPPHRWRDMLAAGVNVAVGTDSRASSPDLNLVNDLRVLHRLAPEVEPLALWHMVTTRAARALGMETTVGSLTSGKCADLVCFSVSGNDDPLRVVLEEEVLPCETWIAGRRVFASATWPRR